MTSIIRIAQLRPTQITVGMLQVKHKCKRLRALEKRPAELVDFLLEHPIRVVMGPAEQAYVIDHHHLALALLLEDFETAPMQVEQDYSSIKPDAFWKKLKDMGFVYPYAKGKRKPLDNIPKKLKSLEDDPYRSLAGFAREAGAFKKVTTPYAEFLWADFYRDQIKEKMVQKHFDKSLQKAIELAHHQDARQLPGFIKAPAK